MDIVSVVGATAFLECAILLIAGVLLLDFKESHRQRRLMRSLIAAIQAAGPAVQANSAVQEVSRPKAA